MEVIWTNQAIQRVREYTDRIAKDNYLAAERWTANIFKKTDRLVTHPWSGKMVPEYNRPELREIIAGDYRIIHLVREDQDKVYINTVRHVREDLEGADK